MFAAFALSPSRGGVTCSAPAPCASSPAASPPHASPPPPPPVEQPLPAPQPVQPDPERDTWAASIYQRLSGSPLMATTLDAQLPTVPVLLHPSVPRGGDPPPITARHLGFLRVDLTGRGVGPGRFYPLFPADATEEEAGVDTGSLDRFGCTGHWASSGCIRLLAAATTTPSTAAGCPPAAADAATSSGTASGGRRLQLLPLDAFAALWERHDGSSSGGGGSIGGSGSIGSGSTEDSWHVPYCRLLPFEEAYGGLYRELKAAGVDLSNAHYMLRGWKTREGRPRLGSSAPRNTTTADTAAGSSSAAAAGSGAGKQRQRRGVVPADVAATRELRALINWPGLLELLEEEGVESVPTDAVRYWMARCAGLQARLAAAGVLCAETSVHHIIARSNRGIDHPLNYFLIDRGPNSAMGSKIEGFRDSSGAKLHMRDIVGDRAFEVALAACNLYHGVLYAGRRRGAPLALTLRELREGAFALAEEALAARQQQQERRRRRQQQKVQGGQQQQQQQWAGSPDAGAGDAGACVAAEAGAPAPPVPAAMLACQPETAHLQQQEQQQGQQQEGSQPRSLKRERGCLGQQQQQQQGEENTPLNSNGLLSPTQQHDRRRRRSSSGEMWLAVPTAAAPAAVTQAAPAAVMPAAGIVALPAAAVLPAAAATHTGTEATTAVAAAGRGLGEEQAEEEVEAGLAGMSLCCSPEGLPRMAADQLEEQQQQVGQQQQEQQRQQSKPAADLGSLRSRLQMLLAVGPGSCGTAGG